ncbi:MAG TPA: hypothetical protein VE133_05080, partial [Candidatus Sulfotelmatobacter sp.]|nr:hypothetical protein [Candidatus Sulfotelmatobacter sp.]
MCLQLFSDRFGDFALDSEHVSQIASVRLGPEMGVVPGVNKLRIYPNLVCDALHAAFKDMGNPERPADFLQIPRCR